MDRRSFLKLFAASTTTYFLPPIGGWKSEVNFKTHYQQLQYGIGFSIANGKIRASSELTLKEMKAFVDYFQEMTERRIALTFGISMERLLCPPLQLNKQATPTYANSSILLDTRKALQRSAEISQRKMMDTILL